jgi:hypothetical protein
MFSTKDSSASHHKGVIDGVAKFADISGPGSATKFGQKIIGDTCWLKCGAGIVDELFDKEGKIIEPFPEGWQSHSEGTQAVEQVFPECTGGDHFGEVAMSRGKEAGGGVAFFAAAYGAEASGFKDSQKFHLNIEWCIGDFIEKQRTTGGGIEESGPGFLGTCECAANVSEEFTLDE